MEKYTFDVHMTVEVESYNKDDAKEALEELFGPGPEGCVDVKDFKVELTNVDG